MKIRRAEPDDARGLLEMHRRSVQELGGEHYDDEVLEAWSPPVDDERVEHFVERTFGGEEHRDVFVAIEGEADSDRVLGFSAVEPDDEYLRAVYVDPEFARSGLGTALLRQAEWAAAQEGAERLELDASINAEDFYLDQGYHRLERGTFEVSDGVEMESVRMEKKLPGPGL